MKQAKEQKAMYAISAPTMRRLVIEANQNEIKREDIVSILKEGEQFVMLYYK